MSDLKDHFIQQEDGCQVWIGILIGVLIQVQQSQNVTTHGQIVQEQQIDTDQIHIRVGRTSRRLMIRAQEAQHSGIQGKDIVGLGGNAIGDDGFDGNTDKGERAPATKAMCSARGGGGSVFLWMQGSLC